LHDNSIYRIRADREKQKSIIRLVPTTLVFERAASYKEKKESTAGESKPIR